MRSGTWAMGAVGMFIPPPQEAVGGTGQMLPRHQSMKVSKSRNQNQRMYVSDSSPSLGRRRNITGPHEALAVRCVHLTLACQMTWTTSTSGHEPQPEPKNGSLRALRKGMPKKPSRNIMGKKSEELEHTLQYCLPPSHTFLKFEDLDKSLARGLPNRVGVKVAAVALQRDSSPKKHQLKVLRVIGPLVKLWSKLEDTRKSKRDTKLDTKLDLNQTLDLVEKTIMLVGQSNVAIHHAGRVEQAQKTSKRPCQKSTSWTSSSTQK